MFDSEKQGIVVFIYFVLFIIVLVFIFILVLIYKYQQKRISYNKSIEQLKVTYENTMLQSQIEMQEQTFQHIAGEIHDNIGQKLTLAKLYLNTLSYKDEERVKSTVGDALSLISDSISGLKDISRSMSTDFVLENGLVKAVETELVNLRKAGLHHAGFTITGREIFLSGNAELVIFRIVQECLNNFLKHAHGTQITINLNYSDTQLILLITDNGRGFDVHTGGEGSGLINMRKRAQMLKGNFAITSSNNGTTITINIPLNENSMQVQPYTG